MRNLLKDVAFRVIKSSPRIHWPHINFIIDVQAGILQVARTKYKDVNDSGR